jgi:hypothetical protein
MSIWWYGRSRNGKRSLWQIDTYPTILIFAVPVIALIIVVSLLNHPELPFVVILFGLACLIVSKVSLFRQGIWFSFGPGRMSKGYTTLYKVACLLMGVGVLLMLLLMNARRGA